MSGKKTNNLFSRIVNNEELTSAGFKMVANIKFRGINEQLKVISIISANKNEGKYNFLTSVGLIASSILHFPSITSYKLDFLNEGKDLASVFWWMSVSTRRVL